VRYIADPASSPTSDGNDILEPGELADVVTHWRNTAGGSRTFSGTAGAFDGPPAPGVAYSLLDPLADYGAVPDATTAPCTDCYRVGVSFGGTRPGTHWDATLQERLAPDTLGQHEGWKIHVGASFGDVPRSSPFYRFVETVLHNGVTTGCGEASYCPATTVTRAQMATFVLTAKEGPLYRPPACTAPQFSDVPATSPFCPWIEELARRGIVAGCGGGAFCPDVPVPRDQMAVFLVRTFDPALQPPACTAAPFADVPASSPYCRWIVELVARGVTAGCGGGNYCPQSAVTRDQMSVFLTGMFALVMR
jgi:hypothetical protein